MELNDWNSQEIYHKDNIKNFDFLLAHKLIQEIEDGYYFLCDNVRAIEEFYYQTKIDSLAKELNIEDVNLEIKKFIAKLNLYNEVKDIADAVMGKLAELKGKTIKELHEEYDLIPSAFEEEKNVN